MEIISADSVTWAMDSLNVARQRAEVLLFGEGSSLCEAVIPRHGATISNLERLTENPTYILLALIFLLLYLVWLPHVIKDGNVRWGMLTRHRYIEGESERTVVGQQRLGMVVTIWLLGISLMSMMAVRFVAQEAPINIPLNGGWWFVGGLIAVASIVMYGWITLKIVGYLIINMEFANKLFSIKRQLLFFSVALLSPLFIINSLANYTQGELVSQLTAFVTVMLLAGFIRYSFLLFIRQNFSILHWFLYLCGVEILPLTFIWAITTRYLGV